MLFLDIKDPAERANLVKEYVTAMKTVKQSNMANRELKLAIGDGLQTLFHLIANATKQAAEETRKELEPMKKRLADIDGALNRATPLEEGESASKPRVYNQCDSTFGFYVTKDGQLTMGDKEVEVDGDYLYVEDKHLSSTQGCK